MAPRATKSVCGSRFVRLTLALIAAGTLLLGYAFAERGGSQAATASPGLAFRLDHFQCYSIKPFGYFRPRRVALVDQFGRSKALVSQKTELCAPVRKNRTPVRNPLAHLACYPIERRTPAFQTRAATITNQFEKVAVRIVKPVKLCVPSGKSVVPAPAPATGDGARPLPVLFRQAAAAAEASKCRPRGSVRQVEADRGADGEPVRAGPQEQLPGQEQARPSRLLPAEDDSTVQSAQGDDRQPVRHGSAHGQDAADALPALAQALDHEARPDRLDREHACSGPLPGGPGTCTMTVTFTITNLSPSA